MHLGRYQIRPCRRGRQRGVYIDGEESRAIDGVLYRAVSIVANHQERAEGKTYVDDALGRGRVQHGRYGDGLLVYP